MRAIYYILGIVIVVAAFFAGYYLNGKPKPDIDRLTVSVDLPKPSKDLRIVTLAPSITEIVAALGAIDNIVGVTEQCDFPAAIKTKKTIGSMISPSIERILALNPDMVIATQTSGNRMETAVALKKEGVPVLSIIDNSIYDLREAYEVIGKFLQRDDEARKLINRLDLVMKMDDVGKQKNALHKAVWIVSRNPFFAAGRTTLHSDVLDALGLTNTMSLVGYQELSAEAFIAMNCDVIFDCSGVDSAWWERLYPTVYKSKRIIMLDQDEFSRPGPRMVEAILRLRKKLPLLLKTETGISNETNAQE